jgi:hypothetical protein
MPMVECQTCQAVYAPAEAYRYLSQAPQVALESALMSMCHFCFRCRRPACPQCWDTVHGVCGECSQEANLPFRAQAAPLRGVLFPIARQAQLRRKQRDVIRLICIIPGRFQKLAPIDEAETRPYIGKPRTRDYLNKQEAPPPTHAPRPTALVPPSHPHQPTTSGSSSTPKDSAARTTNQIPIPPCTTQFTRNLQAGQSTWTFTTNTIEPSQPKQTFTEAPPPLSAQLIAPYPIQPQTTHKPTSPRSEPRETPLQSRATSNIALEDIATRPERPQTEKRKRQTVATRPGKPEGTRKISMNERPILAQRARRGKNTSASTQKKHAKTLGQHIESFCTVLLSTLLVCILILIVLAVISPVANATILHLCHVDIHAELLALWQLLFP